MNMFEDSSLGPCNGRLTGLRELSNMIQYNDSTIIYDVLMYYVTMCLYDAHVYLNIHTWHIFYFQQS